MSKKSRSKIKGRKQVVHHAKSYISRKIPFDIKSLEKLFYRADLELRGIDQSGPSYEGRVFLNNNAANQDTPTDKDHGYVGSFFVFGNGGCFGDIGHCEMNLSKTKYDVIPNRQKPENISLIITEKLKEIAQKSDGFKVTIVPVPADGMDFVCQKGVDLENIVKLDKVSVVTYDLEE
jgi:hypothetical protein